MNLLETIHSSPFIQALGWTLLHFLWQGALITLLLGLALLLMRQSRASARYLACCFGMILMLAAPVVTLITIVQSSPRPVAEVAFELFPLSMQTFSLWEIFVPLLPWLTLIWFGGTCSLQGRLLLHWMAARRLRSRGTRLAPTVWQRKVRLLRRQLGIQRTVLLFQSTIARVPMVMGWLRPVILIPAGVLKQMTPRQLRMVIAHELAHIRRHDFLINLIQAVFESLLFYHPGVWWLSKRLRIEREYCCDDLAVQVCRDPLCYARALSYLDELRDDERQTVLATTGGALMKRIFRLVGVPSKPSHPLGGWLVTLTFAAALTATISAMGFSQAAPGKSEKAKTPVHLKGTDKKADFEKDLIAKLKEEGKSKEEISKILEEVLLKKKAKEKEAKWAAYEKELVAKLKEERKTPEEIKKILTKAYKERQAKEEQAKVLALERELAAKMKKEGKSSQEIKKALDELYKKKMKIKKAEEPSYEKKLVMKMKQEGKSEKEIKKALKELEIKKKKDQDDAAKKAAYELSLRMKKERALIKERETTIIKAMTADGKSLKEIRLAVNEMRKKVKAELAGKVKKADYEKDLIKKMQSQGKSKEEIKKALQELKTKGKVANKPERKKEKKKPSTEIF